VKATLDTLDKFGTCLGCYEKKPIGYLMIEPDEKKPGSGHSLGRYCLECLKAIHACIEEQL
jgi:hypothetical protein